jgi:hypothetical protein
MLSPSSRLTGRSRALHRRHRVVAAEPEPRKCLADLLRDDPGKLVQLGADTSIVRRNVSASRFRSRGWMPVAVATISRTSSGSKVRSQSWSSAPSTVAEKIRSPRDPQPASAARTQPLKIVGLFVHRPPMVRSGILRAAAERPPKEVFR